VSAQNRQRLDGLEPDNVLAFLALLGLLRALGAHDSTLAAAERLNSRAAWDVDVPPLRPLLFVAKPLSRDDLMSRVAHGIDMLARLYEFDGREDLNYSQESARTLLENSAKAASGKDRAYADLLASLMTDGAVKDHKDSVVDPTPLCLLFGQGHQHFLGRLASVPRQPVPALRGRSAGKSNQDAKRILFETLFEPWHRSDASESFRWDPKEDVRHALMAGDPTDPAYKAGTQHGANRLAALGLASLTVVPQDRGGRVRPAMVGGAFAPGFFFAWPIWREPATIDTIRGLLAHPQLRSPDALRHLGIEYVFVARRISAGKFMNFTRARRLDGQTWRAAEGAGP
jgi:hypothetical protein